MSLTESAVRAAESTGGALARTRGIWTQNAATVVARDERFGVLPLCRGPGALMLELSAARRAGHMTRVIRERDVDAIFIAGPRHGGPGVVANTYLEGTHSEVYPTISRDVDGLKRFVTRFSFPGGIPSHVAAETPGSINEGGELG